jgi:hypothetical protein
MMHYSPMQIVAVQISLLKIVSNSVRVLLLSFTSLTTLVSEPRYSAQPVPVDETTSLGGVSAQRSVSAIS